MTTLIEQCDCMSVAPADLATACTVMITDPPYSRHVHGTAVSHSAKGGYRHRDFGFGHLTPALRRWLGRVAAALPRWSVLYSDVEHSSYLRISCQAAGARYVRTIPWVRWSMPQMTGTMPPQGFEHLIVAHNKRGQLRWNGPGNLLELSPLADECMRGGEKHKAQKPLSQALTLVSYFSDPGETVLDPLAGSGTTALACAMLGRDCVALEADESWVPRIRERLHGTLSTRDRASAERWLERSDDGATTERARARQVIRDEDRARVRDYLR